MRKIIKRKIHISTHKRDLIDFINDEFYSHDKHNAFLEFTMKSLPTDNIIALFYFQKTKRYVETKAFVDGDKFTIEFDTSLINTDETVLGFIYFEKVSQSADVHRFSFGVKVSEIDKLHDIPIEEAKTKRVVAIEDIVTKAELDELFKQIEKNGGTYNDTEIRNSISSISERVQTLENKPDNDTRYDDSDVKSRLNVLETNASRYLTEHQPLNSIEERIQQVEARFNDLSNIYLSSHQSLEHLATKDALDKVEQRVEQLEQNRVSDNHDFITRQELEGKHYLTSVPDELINKISALENKQVVTKEELEAKHYLTSVPEEYAKKSELYNDSALTERVSLLEAKAISNGAYDDKPLLDKIHAIEEQFRNASNLYLQSHQSLEHLVTKKALEDAGYLKEHQSLEGYAKKTELYNDSELREKITALETNSVTHSELASKNYLIEHQPLTDYATNSKVEAVESRVLALENKPSIDTNEFAKKSEIPQAYDDSALSGRVSALEAKEDKDTVYNDEEIKRRLTTLEGKTDNFITGVSVNKEGSNVTLTYNYVDGQTKNVSFTDSDTVNVAYDDSGLKQRITNLENRPQVDLTDYAKKSEIPQAYNDSELSRRVSVLETKEDKDTIYNDEEIKRRLTTLEAKPTVDVSAFAKKTEVPTVDSVNTLLRTQGEQLVKINALEAKAGYEIHGTGMPNGKVTAPIGTTYVDMAVTNGALKWIKESGNELTGWKVLVGDTGWRTLKTQSLFGSSFVKVRRVNNIVSYQFGGLDWGKFGIVRRGGNGFVTYGNNPKLCRLTPNDGIPVGFRTGGSVTGPVYNDNGVIIGAWYVGGARDLNHLRFAFVENIPTDRDIKDMRVSNIMYLTDDDWPTTLP